MLPDILDFGVEFLKSHKGFAGDLPCRFDVGVLGHEDSYNEVLVVRQVDEVVIVVEVHYRQLRVGLGLSGKMSTFCRLPLVWLSALISRVVVWMNF
jgi:hypothetical protein